MKIRQLGYTLIELLVVISIIVIFSALFLANYRDFVKERKLDSEAKQLIDALDLASKKTSSPDFSPDVASVCTDFQGYKVTFDSATSYSLKFTCTGISDILVQTYTLSSGITISSPTSSILYKPLNAGTNLVVATSITISNPTNGRCKKIQVNPIGTVEQLSTCP